MGNRVLQVPNPQPWPIAGSPTPGTIAALAICRDEDYVVFAGTRTGLYRARWSPTATTRQMHQEVQAHWRRLPAAPLEIISLGVSPNYARDSTILAGTARGLFLSRDGGEHWQTAHTPMPDSVILCFCFSTNYQVDGIILAGTLEDGVYYSDSRGAHWSFRGFGLQDAAIYSLTISPDFASDETVFAGAESALYYSYNGARAWKPLEFPEGSAPVLSLALSPRFSHDQTIYAGTERQGLYRSTDLGKTWQQSDLPATCINALAVSPQAGGLFAATNTGLYHLGNGDQPWTCLFDRPDAFSMAVSDEVIIASVANQGAWWTMLPSASGAAGQPAQMGERGDLANWRPFFTMPARSLTGMVLSPHFDTEPIAFLYGPQEGIWRTEDGGVSWSCLNEALPDLDIWSMAISPDFFQDRLLVAASTAGLLMSEDAGDHWTLLAGEGPIGPCSLVAFSPGARFIAAGSLAGEIWLAERLAGPWQKASGAQEKSQLLALAIADNAWLRIALLDQAQEVVRVYEGEPGRLDQRLVRPASPTPVVRFYIPPDGAPGGAWYASLDHQVWEFQGSPEEGSTSATLAFEAEDGGRVLDLAGSQAQTGFVLFACTGQTIYQSTGTGSWTAVHDFGDEVAVAIALSPAYPDNPTAFALLLGGSFCRGILK